MPRSRRLLAAVGVIATLWHTSVSAQAPLAGGLPGRWIEANALAQRVSNGYGNWQGLYVRGVRPSARDTWYVDALALHAFGENGLQVGATHRHDWNGRVFQMLGASVGSGASIMPRGRVDGALGVRLGAQRRWQATGGVSYVKSVTELSDLAGIASLAWYAPHAVMIEVGGRYNSSRPGNIKSHRLSTTAAWTPSPKRTFSVRGIGGSEGWQVVRTGTTLTRFQSQEGALAWREKVTDDWALSIQGDWYHNPYYTRSGVTLGVARYW
ncbi:MAG: YaiO family outer membrane beta-barrel protein [Gemmatimonadaceae bacterium]|nr:YaiO family outer membrane beta-barrel protein [Gemmatimonadaceae bacterium]